MPIKALNVAGKRLITTAFMAALAVSVAGCGSTSKFTTGSIGRSDSKPLETMSANELHSATTRLGESYARNPNDKRIATNYAAALQMDGRNARALATCGHLASLFHRDYDTAQHYLDRALAACPNDPFGWALSSATMSYTGNAVQAIPRALHSCCFEPDSNTGPNAT